MARTLEENLGLGKRKNAIARIRLRKGSGNIVINGKALDQYFGRQVLPMLVRQPLNLTKTIEQFDVHANVIGGGVTGQAEALRHGIARALVDWNPELKKSLRDEGYMTRDSRIVERKKYGRKKARRRFQYSKR